MMSTHQKDYKGNKTDELYMDTDMQHARDVIKPERKGPLRRARHLFEDYIKRDRKQEVTGYQIVGGPH